MIINELLTLTVTSFIPTYIHSVIFKVFFCVFKMESNHFM